MSRASAARDIPADITRIMHHVADADRAWFDRHPGRPWRVRRAIPHEVWPEEIETTYLLVVRIPGVCCLRIPVWPWENADRLAVEILGEVNRAFTEEAAG